MSLPRRAHRILGLVLLLPICGWVITGLVFFIKPGYSAAYGGLRVRTYSLEGAVTPPARREWLEVRLLRSILGDHLLVQTEGGRVHLDSSTLEPRPLPDELGLRRLVGDAITVDAERYGTIAGIERREGSAPSATITTTTGVIIDLDWPSLACSQSGSDTRVIDGLYRVHYLQWTGIDAVDRVMGVVGLSVLLVLAILGARLAFASRP